MREDFSAKQVYHLVETAKLEERERCICIVYCACVQTNYTKEALAKHIEDQINKQVKAVI
jgi:hypothetical protein